MTPPPRNTILHGDALTVLSGLPTASVDCAVTSPPYYQLRDYAVPGQLGTEPDVDRWVLRLQAVITEIARVLKPSGAFWLNLGDSFSRHPRYGAPTKSLLLAPERLLLALSGDGWLVRNRIVWAKTNPPPSSVRDRLTLSWEVMYLLVRSPRYYFDLDAIRIPHRTPGTRRQPPPRQRPAWYGPLAASGDRIAVRGGVPGHPLGKNPGDVWPVTNTGYRGAHRATFPPDLARRPIAATCPPLVCGDCGLPAIPAPQGRTGPVGPRCTRPSNPQPGLVLDPFFGSGTVGVVAQRLGRDWLGIELNPTYVDVARLRIGQAANRHHADQPMRDDQEAA